MAVNFTRVGQEVQVNTGIQNNQLLPDVALTTSGRFFVRNALVVVEVALALVLLIGAGLMMRSVFRLTNIEPGFDSKNVATLSVSLSPTKYSDAAKVRRFYQQTLERVQSLPGVESAAWTIGLPLAGSNETAFAIPGRPRSSESENDPLAVEYAASPDYIRALGIPLIQGRHFNEQDNEKSSKVVIIDELSGDTNSDEQLISL